MSNKAYDKITDQILVLLAQGVVPWRRSWTGGAAGMPKSFSSRKSYRGVNTCLLDCVAMVNGYSSRYWATYRQAAKLGGNVRKGEHGTTVVFWKWLDVDDRANPGQSKKIPFLRFYSVFNLDQTDGLTGPKDDTEPVQVHDFTPIQAAAKIVQDMPQRPTITHNEQRACYRPSVDTVNMPKPETFGVADHYYSTLFHELVHATGAPSRLDRDKADARVAAFGSGDYGQEELLAEFGAAFLCGESGIVAATIENQAAYIRSWQSKIKANTKLVVLAAAAAQRAADFILGRSWD